MPVIIPKLQRTVGIVEADGKPTQVFQQWWQSVAKAIEAAVLTLEETIQQVIDILVRLGLVEVTADGALALAESAINPDGTIKDDKVLTESIIADGVTQRYFSQTLSDITLPDGVETEVASVTLTKVLDESDVDIDPSIRFESSDDVRGFMRIYRDAVMIDEFDARMDGAGGNFRICQTMPFTDISVPAGIYIYKIAFERAGGASTLYAVAGSTIRAKEYKR